MSSRARKLLVGTAAAAALVFSGCTATGWVAAAPPAAGSQAELGNRDKVRNVLFVVDETGTAMLVGQLSTVDGTVLQGISYVAQSPSGQVGDPAEIPFGAEIAPDKAIRLEQEHVMTQDPSLVAGGLAEVTFHLTSGDLSLQAPVYANTHKDFEAVWEAGTEA